MPKQIQGILAHALPTRCHPQGDLDGKRDWARFAENLTRFAQTGEGVEGFHTHLKKFQKPARIALKGLIDQISGGEPEAISVKGALKWLRRLIACFSFRGNKNFSEPFMQWLVTKIKPREMVELTLEIILREYYYAANLAVRSALVKTPAPYYDEVLALMLRHCQDPQVGWIKRAYLALILADDRPQMHALNALAVGHDAKAATPDEWEDWVYVRLILDTAPSALVKRGFRQAEPEILLTDFLPAFQVGATAVAVARHYGESAGTLLKWMMPWNWRHIASIVIDLDEPEVFSLVLPYLWDEGVAQLLDAAAAQRPADIFAKCMGAVLSGCAEPRLLARVHAVIRSTSMDELQGWVGHEARALAYIEKAQQAENVREASPDLLPRVLRGSPLNPVGPRKEPNIFTVEPIATPIAWTPFEESKGGNPVQELKGASRMLDYIQFYIVKFQRLRARSSPLLEKRVLSGMDYAVSHQLIPQLERWCEKRDKNSPIYTGYPPQQGAMIFFLFHGFPFFPEHHSANARLLNLVIERLGDKALPALIKYLEIDPHHGWEYLKRLDAPAIAPLAARALLQLNSVRAKAAEWLVQYRHTALMRLIPQALGYGGAERQAARNALHWLIGQSEDGRAAFEHAAGMYIFKDPRLTQALMDVRSAEIEDQYQRVNAKLPDWLNLAALTRPQLIRGGSLGEGAVVALLQMLKLSAPDAVHPGIFPAKEALSPRSLAVFAWDLFSMWLSQGAPDAENWAMWTLGWLGDDECCESLTQLILIWPNQRARSRAKLGLKALSDMDCEAALANLIKIAFKASLKVLRESASSIGERIARSRGLSLQELADALVPSLNLDALGGLDLDFGPRRFRVGFDEFLTPFVKDASGKPLKAFPHPSVSDDQSLVKEARAQWKKLKEDLKEIGASQIQRLETMLATSRRIDPETFLQFFASHPLMRNLTTRLVWGVYQDDDPASAPRLVFRVCEDLSLADIEERHFDLRGADRERSRVGLAHPMELIGLGAGMLEAWRALFADYKIGQPIAQLWRETYALTEQEKQSCQILRFEGQSVSSKIHYDLYLRGWISEEHHMGVPSALHMKIRICGRLAGIRLAFIRQIHYSGGQYNDWTELGKLSIFACGADDAEAPLKFDLLSAKEASEIIRLINILGGAGAIKH